MKSNNAYVEHANISVVNAEELVRFLIAAIPEWSVRGQGEMDWSGEIIQWYHVGDDYSYIAVQNGGTGEVDDWRKSWTGVKHIGIVVPNLDALVERLTACGYEVDHFGRDHPHRKNVYFLESHNVQFEFMEYTSREAGEKNDYSL